MQSTATFGLLELSRNFPAMLYGFQSFAMIRTCIF